MIIVIGSTTADTVITANLPGRDADGFQDGNVVFTTRPAVATVGGNGANSAFVLSGLGANTQLCSAVGDDMLGQDLIRRLSENGVGLLGLKVDSTKATSTSTIIAQSHESQVVFHHAGAYADLTLEDLPLRLVTLADQILITGYPLMTGLRPDGLAELVKTAKRSGTEILLDVGPAIGEELSLSEIESALSDVDYLIGNAIEITSLAQATGWKQASDRLLNAGVKNLVVKHGPDGATLINQRDEAHFDAYQVGADATVGAGDAFNAGFAYALGEESPTDACVRFGQATAALVLTGNQPHGPSASDVSSLLDNAPTEFRLST